MLLLAGTIAFYSQPAEGQRETTDESTVQVSEATTLDERSPGEITTETTTGSRQVEESTTSANPSANASPSAARAACANPVELLSIGPTTDNSVTPFESTGRTFRVTYTVEFTNPDAFNNLNIDIEDRFGLVAFENINESGSDSYIVTEGPGSYDLVINVEPANGATYSVTVEDCGATTPGPAPGPEPPPDPGPPDDPENPGNKPPGLIDETIPKKPKLANTGGPPILLGAAILLAGAALVSVRVLRP